MFYHNFKYTLKTLLKNKALIFWTFAFPLILGFFFNMAFSGLDDKESFNPLDIAVIENEEYKSSFFKDALESVSSSSSSFQAFNLQYVTKEEAEDLLKKEDIVGYITYENGQSSIHISYSNINATIMKSVIDEINYTLKVSENLITNELINEKNINYEEISTKVQNIIASATPNIKDTSSSHLSYITIEFYTLIAMTCLYGGTISMTAINTSLANMSSKGKRISVSPTKKIITTLSALLAGYIVQLFGIIILFIFLYYIIKVDFGNRISYCILLSMVGSLAGLSLGLFTGSVIKTNEANKIGIIIAISMAYSFFSGMMGVVLKYYIDKYVPFINKINPANMITDAFYSLYYYDTLNRFYFNIISLILYSLILFTISTIVLRRQKYESI